VRVLLDEQLPLDLAGALHGHTVDTVVGLGWAGITNGELSAILDALLRLPPSQIQRIGE